VVRPVPDQQTPVLARRFLVEEVLKGKLRVTAGTVVPILQTDRDAAMNVHEAPEPGMHVSWDYLLYASSAPPGTSETSHIAFLCWVPYLGQQMLVYTVNGSIEPVERRSTVIEAVGGWADGELAEFPENPSREPRSPWTTLRRAVKRLIKGSGSLR
jgi:hypothetical protein